MDTSVLFESKEYFPILINLGEAENELISIVKRPRITQWDIIDIYSNQSHVGMFIRIEKTQNQISFGPSTINKTHDYRNILPFVFVKLLEYYGLKDISVISLSDPKNQEFNKFLEELGFILDSGFFTINLNEDNLKVFVEKLEKMDLKISTKAGQLKSIIKFNNPDKDSNYVAKLADKLVKKVKRQESVNPEFWENRRIAQMNVMIASAILNQKRLHKEEFFEVIMKTIISYFDLNIRKPLMKELFAALKGKIRFSKPHIQSIIEKLQSFLDHEIKTMDEDFYFDWYDQNLASWRLNQKIHEQTLAKKEENSVLIPSDFGTSVIRELEPIITSMINHYNGKVVFFGMDTRI